MKVIRFTWTNGRHSYAVRFENEVPLNQAGFYRGRLVKVSREAYLVVAGDDVVYVAQTRTTPLLGAWAGDCFGLQSHRYASIRSLTSERGVLVVHGYKGRGATYYGIEDAKIRQLDEFERAEARRRHYVELLCEYRAKFEHETSPMPVLEYFDFIPAKTYYLSSHSGKLFLEEGYKPIREFETVEEAIAYCDQNIAPLPDWQPRRSMWPL